MKVSKVNIGEFKTRIYIQRLNGNEDLAGGLTGVTWPNVFEVWAKVIPLSANQRFFASQQQHRVSFNVLIRYVAGITSGMRIQFKDDATRILQIHGIIDVEEKKRFLLLECEEGAAA